MPISLACDCGTKLKVKEDMIGRKVRCPRCSGVVTVPEPVKEEEKILDVLPVPDEQPAKETYALQPEGMSLRTASFQKVEEPLSFETKEPRARPRPLLSEGWFGSVNGGVLGGLGMIGIAVVWFVLGLMVNRIFIYPPILLVIGIIAVVKGLANGE